MSKATKDRFRNDNFRVMPHFSPSLVSLLRRILCADPSRRATIDEIRQHEWYMSGTTRESAATSGAEASPVATPPHTPASTPDSAAHAPATRLDFAAAVEVESGMPPVIETGESTAPERCRQTNLETPHNIVEEDCPGMSSRQFWWAMSGTQAWHPTSSISETLLSMICTNQKMNRGRAQKRQRGTQHAR